MNLILTMVEGMSLTVNDIIIGITGLAGAFGVKELVQWLIARDSKKIADQSARIKFLESRIDEVEAKNSTLIRIDDRRVSAISNISTHLEIINILTEQEDIQKVVNQIKNNIEITLNITPAET